MGWALLWLGTKSRRKSLWSVGGIFGKDDVASELARTQKGSGGWLSWNSAWMLEEGSQLGSAGSLAKQSLPACPLLPPKPGTHTGMARLWVGQKCVGP